MSNWNGAVFTFAGAVEHHAGMKISGEKRDPLTTDELKIISSKFPKEDIKLIEIGKEYGIKDASVLFIKNGQILGYTMGASAYPGLLARAWWWARGN